MKDNQVPKFLKMQSISKILKANMKWQKLEEAKVQLLEIQKLKALQKEMTIYQELYKATIKVKILLDLDLQKYKENDH